MAVDGATVSCARIDPRVEVNTMMTTVTNNLMNE
jgi:hypothetical protein